MVNKQLYAQHHLQELRKRANLYQQELADECKIPRSTLHAAECGRRPFNDDMINRIILFASNYFDQDELKGLGYAMIGTQKYVDTSNVSPDYTVLIRGIAEYGDYDPDIQLLIDQYYGEIEQFRKENQ